MAVAQFGFVDGPIEVFTVNYNGEDWFLANTFAEALGYNNPYKGVRDHVSPKNVTEYKEFRSDRCGRTDESSPLPRNVQPNTKFINRAGVLQLITSSDMPAAKAFQTWNHNELLPKLCQDGDYNMTRDAPTNIQIGMRAVHAATNKGARAPWFREPCGDNVAQFDRQFAAAQSENYELKLELTKTVAKYDARIAELQLTNERQVSAMRDQHQRQVSEMRDEHQRQICEMRDEHQRQISKLKEHEFRIKMAVRDVMYASNDTTGQMLANAMLADENIRINEEMYARLQSVRHRVVPALDERPDKAEMLVGYVRGGGRDGTPLEFKMMRCQRFRLDLCDKLQKRYDTVGRPPPASYEWLRTYRKFFEVECANAVTLWNKVRADNPHFFYGVPYTNASCTDMVVLTETQLREAYRRDASNVSSMTCDEFEALELHDENEAVRRCLVRPGEAIESFHRMVKQVLVSTYKETVCERPVTRDDAANRYTFEQFLEYMNMGDKLYLEHGDKRISWYLNSSVNRFLANFKK